MQYEPSLSRAALIDLATIQYFGNVDAKNMDATLACFQDEALFCVQTDFTRHAGKEEIRRMFADFFGAMRRLFTRISCAPLMRRTVGSPQALKPC